MERLRPRWASVEEGITHRSDILMISYGDGPECLGKPVLMMSEITISYRYRSLPFAGSSMFPRLIPLYKKSSNVKYR